MTYFWNQLGQTTIIAIAMHGLNNDSIGLGGRVESESFIPQLFTQGKRISKPLDKSRVI